MPSRTYVRSRFSGSCRLVPGLGAQGTLSVGFVVLLLFLTAAQASGEGWEDPSGKSWNLAPVPGEWLVRFHEGTSPPEAGQLVSGSGAEALRGYGPRTRTMIVRAGAADPASAVGTALRSSPAVESVTPVFRDDEGFRKYLLPGRLTVQFDRGVDAMEAERQIAEYGSLVLRRYRTAGYYQITAPSPGDDPVAAVFAALRDWSARPDVRFAEPVYLGFDDALMEAPDDPFFLSQWGLRNSGNGSWEETADVWADAAWWITSGSPDVVIAIVDTGMDMGHEDLAPSLLPQNGEVWDFVDGDPVPQDLDNHGTLVTGISSAVRGNGLGISGLAPDCPVMPLRVSLDEGEIAERVDAIQYCATRRPEFAGLIVNCSWGNSSGDFTSVRLAIQDAVAAGCVVVCSAGNSNSDVIYPARYPEPIAVGATSPCDERKSPSSCDGETWGSCFGPELDLVAPGVRIYTTDRTGNLGLSSSDYWPFFNGTSASAPFVSALCALVQSVAPDLTPAEVQALLEASADDEVGIPAEDTPGFDVYMGWGRINGWKALVLATHPDGILDDLESPDPFWRHEALDSGGDPWHLTTLENHTEGGVQCWSGADGDSGTYPIGMDAALYLPDVQVPEEGELVFWHRMDAFQRSAHVAGDGGFLEASVDGGETWFGLDPEDGYTHTIQDLGNDPYPLGQAVFSGLFDWREDRIDLAAFAGSPIRIRFRFGSRSDALAEELGAGWRIDDVSVEGRDLSAVTPGDAAAYRTVLEGLSFPALYRPGDRVRFSLLRSVDVRLGVFSAGGRRVARRDFGSRPRGLQEIRLDDLLAGTPSGSYWLHLHAGAERRSAKILVVQ